MPSQKQIWGTTIYSIQILRQFCQGVHCIGVPMRNMLSNWFWYYLSWVRDALYLCDTPKELVAIEVFLNCLYNVDQASIYSIWDPTHAYVVPSQSKSTYNGVLHAYIVPSWSTSHDPPCGPGLINSLSSRMAGLISGSFPKGAAPPVFRSFSYPSWLWRCSKGVGPSKLQTCG